MDPLAARPRRRDAARHPRRAVAPRRAARLDRGDLVATAFFGATGLPIIVAVTAIGVDQGDLSTGTAAALVGAGMLSVLLFPLIALAVRRRSPDASTLKPDDDVQVPTEG